MDGLGDTIRVSLTEDPELELNPCADLAAVSCLHVGWCPAGFACMQDRSFAAHAHDVDQGKRVTTWTYGCELSFAYVRNCSCSACGLDKHVSGPCQIDFKHLATHARVAVVFARQRLFCDL